MKNILISLSMVAVLIVQAGAETENNTLVGKKVLVTIRDSGIKATSGYVLGVDNDTLRLGTRGKVRLERVVTVDNRVVEFSPLGGRYNPDSQTVSGVSAAGEPLVIPMSEIRSADLTHFINGKWLPMTFDRDAIQKRLKHNITYPAIQLQIPIDSVRTVKVWRKRNNNAVLLSVLCGGAMGYAMGWATAEDPPPEEWDIGPKMTRDAKITLDTAIGLVAGGVIGYAIFKGRWTKVPLDRLKVNMSASPSGGIGLTCSVVF